MDHLARAKRWLPSIIAFIIVVSFGLNVFLIHGHPSATFFLPFTRAWELLIGAALVVSPKPKGAINEAAAAAGSLCIAASFAFFDAKTSWLGRCITRYWMSLLILTEGSLFSRLLSLRPAVGIGLISYPLYCGIGLSWCSSKSIYLSP
jgi:peptidoglycan/LPS O-acetylase OafA/YrhL